MVRKLKWLYLYKKKKTFPRNPPRRPPLTSHWPEFAHMFMLKLITDKGIEFMKLSLGALESSCCRVIRGYPLGQGREAVSLELYGSIEVGGLLSNSEVLLEKWKGGILLRVTVAAVTSKPSHFSD